MRVLGCFLGYFRSRSCMQKKKEKNNEEKYGPTQVKWFNTVLFKRSVSAKGGVPSRWALSTWSSPSCDASAHSTNRPTRTQQKWQLEHYVFAAEGIYSHTFLYKYSLSVCSWCHRKRERPSNDTSLINASSIHRKEHCGTQHNEQEIKGTEVFNVAKLALSYTHTHTHAVMV